MMSNAKCKNKEIIFVQVLSKGGLQVKITKTTTVAVFPRGSKKRETNNDDKHDHGQEIRRPSILCRREKLSLSALFWNARFLYMLF